MLILLGLGGSHVDPGAIVPVNCTLPAHCSLPCYSKPFRLKEGGGYRRAGHNEARVLYHPEVFSAGDVVVDVGAFEGNDLARVLRKRMPPIAVHAYEPVAAIRERLARNVAPFRQVTVHPFGIGSANRTSCFIGVGQDAHERGAHACRQPSEVVDVAWAISPFERIKLLHINCEGCELQVMRRILASGVLSKISLIEMQVVPR